MLPLLHCASAEENISDVIDDEENASFNEKLGYINS